MHLKNLIAKFVCLLSFLLVMASSSFAQTTYYVNGVTGNNLWTGTSNVFVSGNVGPKKTIQDMVTASVNGDVISIAAATYNETVTIDATHKVILDATGVVNISDLILNTQSATALAINEDGAGADDLTITTKLTLTSGVYTIDADFILGAGAIYEIVDVNLTYGFDQAIPSTAGYTLTFANTTAQAYAVFDIGDNNPGNVNFTGTGAVTLPAALTATGDVVVGANSGVVLGAFDLTILGEDLTNNGGITSTGGDVIMTLSANGTYTGTGALYDFTIDGAAFDLKLQNDVTITNLNATTASLLTLNNAADLDLNGFDFSTPGNVTVTSGNIIDGSVANDGIFAMTGTNQTIGAVNLTLTGAAETIKRFKIDKPSGSTVNLVTNDLTISDQFTFTGGIFNIAALNLTLSAAHGTTASIGGNINGTTGIFTVSATNTLTTVTGAGQINCLFTVNTTAGKIVSFTNLTTIGNNLTVTSGGLTTASLQLINGTVTLTAGTTTFNTASLSVTNTFTLATAATLSGSAPITVSGTFNHDGAGIVDMTGTLTVAVYDGTSGGAASGDFTSGGLATTGAGAMLFGDGDYDVNGNLTAGGAVTTAVGTVSVSGNATSGGAFTTAAGAVDVDNNLTVGGVLTTAAGLLNVDGWATVAGNIEHDGAGNLVVDGNLTTTASGDYAPSSTGDMTVGGNLVIAGDFLQNDGNDVVVLGTGASTIGGALTGSTGTLTVTGTIAVTGNLTADAGDMAFNGTGTHSVGGQILTGDVNAATGLTFGGNLTVGNKIAPVHQLDWDFLGSVTLTSSTDANNDIDLTDIAGAAVIDFNGNVVADDLKLDGALITTINFIEGTGLVSQFNDIDVAADGSGAVTIVTVGGATANEQHYLKVNGDLTWANANAGGTNKMTVNTNGRLVFNGQGEIHNTAATFQVFTSAVVQPSIANLEINNTAIDANKVDDDEGGDGSFDDTIAAVQIPTGSFAITVTNLYLTNNGLWVEAAGDLNIAAGGTITQNLGLVQPAFTAAGARNLVYTNSSNILSGFELSNAGVIDDVTLSGLEVELQGNLALTGILTVGATATLGTYDTDDDTDRTVTLTTDAANADDDIFDIDGAITGTGAVAIAHNDNATTFGITGAGTMDNLTVTFTGATATLDFAGISAINDLTTAGGDGNGVLNYSGPAVFGDDLVLNNDAVNFRKSVTVTDFFDHNEADVTAKHATDAIYYDITVGGNYDQDNGVTQLQNFTVTGTFDYDADGLTIQTNGIVSVTGVATWNSGGTFTLSEAGDATFNSTFTTTGGSITFPANGTGNLILKGATVNMGVAGAGSYVFGGNATGRVSFQGAVAQTLNLTQTSDVDRFELNNATGLLVTGTGVQLQSDNLLLTLGTLTHNGLLNMPNAGERIVRDAGALASFAATGPKEVEYIGTVDITTGYEVTTSTLTSFIVNLTGGTPAGPTVTLDKNVTLQTGGTLNLSKGILATGSNSLITQATYTVTRAEGSLVGTPTYGANTTLQYYNSVSDLTAGTEFTNDGSIVTLLLNAPGHSVTLSANAQVAGAVTIQFGTLAVSDFIFNVSGAMDVDGAITAGTGHILFSGATDPQNVTGSLTSLPKVVINKTAFNDNVDVANDGLDFTFGDLTIEEGTLSFTGMDDVIFGGVVDVQSDGILGAVDGVLDITNVDDAFVTGSSFTIDAGATFTQVNNALVTMQGADAQTLNVGEVMLELAIDNANGVTLGGDLVIEGGTSDFILTSGNLITGANNLQLGTTQVVTVARTSGMVVGNLHMWIDTDAAVVTSTVFHVGDGTNYSPITLQMPNAAGALGDAIARVTYSATAPDAGTVGIPLTNGGVTVDEIASMRWKVGFYDETTNTDLFTPLSNPTVIMTAGNYIFGDINLIRGLTRLVNELNTWSVPGTFDQAYYTQAGSATVKHTNVSSWDLEAEQYFAIGYASALQVAATIANQTLQVGGQAFVEGVSDNFSGAIGTLIYTATTSNAGVATVAVVGTDLTVTPVAEGTATITLTATDVNADSESITFTVTVNLAPVFTAPVANTLAMDEGTTQVVNFAATGTGTITLSNTTAVAFGTFDAATGDLTLAPDLTQSGVYTVVVTATSTTTLSSTYTLTVTVNGVNQAPTVTAGAATATVNYGTPGVLTFTGADVDAQDLTYTHTIPTFAGTNPGVEDPANTYTVTLTPTTADIGDTFTLTATASDGTLTGTAATAVTVAADLINGTARVYGDVDGSGGAVELADALAVLEAWAGNTTLTAAQLWAADVNGNGVLDLQDALYILEKWVGNITTFPVETGALAKMSSVNTQAYFGSMASVDGMVAIPVELTNVRNVSTIGLELALTGEIEEVTASANVPSDWLTTYKYENGQLKLGMVGTSQLTSGKVATVYVKLANKEATAEVNGFASVNELEISLNNFKVVELPTEFALQQNYPNPFNPSTIIKYSIAEPTEVSLKIYDVIGREVANLVNDLQEAGNYQLIWNSTNNMGQAVSAGVYIYRIEAGSFVATKKMMLVK